MDLLEGKENQIIENKRIQREINSLNEELQTTMEELQSSTEELLEKNEELKRLERELEVANEKLREKLKEEEGIASKREKFIESILSSIDNSVIINDVGDEMNIIFVLENLYGKKYFDDKIK